LKAIFLIFSFSNERTSAIAIITEISAASNTSFKVPLISAPEQMNEPKDEKCAENGGPCHLIVLCHGLAGRPSDLDYLERTLRDKGGEGVKVLNSRSNVGKTRDGVSSGGNRLAAEIEETVKSTPSLEYFSIVGNSLGGLYARYAVMKLYSDGKIANLEPMNFMTIASPHLGVRKYTWGVMYPKTMFPIASVLFGQTGKELFLHDSDHEPDQMSPCDISQQPLIMKMALDEEFLQALRAFKSRRIYSNLRGDFMVSMRTAAIEPADFEANFPPTKPHELFLGRNEGIIVTEQKNIPEENCRDIKQASHAEDVMALSLNKLEWSKVIVDFGAFLIPSHHNKICAHSANIWTRYFCSAGKNIMNNATDFILHSQEEK